MTKKFQEIKKLGKVVFFLIDLLYIELRPPQQEVLLLIIKIKTYVHIYNIVDIYIYEINHIQ